MHVCIYVCMYACKYVYYVLMLKLFILNIATSLVSYPHKRTCFTPSLTYTWKHSHAMYVFMYVCVYVCMYVCLFVCTYVSMHACMYVGM